MSEKSCKICRLFYGKKCSKHLDFEQITPDMEVCADFQEGRKRFSQAPWKIIGNHIFSSDVNCFGGNTTVCRIYEQCSESKEIANAALIAAAPEIYEALFDLVGKCRPGWQEVNVSKETIEKALKALKKARGE